VYNSIFIPFTHCSDTIRYENESLLWNINNSVIRKLLYELIWSCSVYRLAAELESTSVRGGSTVAGRMFARRRDRAERSVVPETPSVPARPAPQARPSPPETVIRQPPQSHRASMLGLYLYLAFICKNYVKCDIFTDKGQLQIRAIHRFYR